MPLYVLALTDVPLGPWTLAGRRLQSVAHAGVHAIYERRSAAPPLTDEELRAQHALVVAIAGRVGAVLPARFGSLLQARELTALIRRHEPAIRAALEQVRDRVQMTVRVVGTPPKDRSAAQIPASSGREYLERARRASTPPLPRSAQRIISAVQPWVVAERRQAGAGRLLATIYHLVDASRVGEYRQAAGTGGRGVIVSGPWPPFAFTPQLW